MMFDYIFSGRVAELERQLVEVRKDRDDAWDSVQNCRQQISYARNEADRMKRAMSEEGLSEIASVTARRIEDLFVHHPGTRESRLNAVQAMLREVMRANLTGATNWQGPSEPGYSHPPPPIGSLPPPPPNGGA